MSSETTKGLTFEEAHAAKPVGYIFKANTTLNDLSTSVEAHITLGEKQKSSDINVYAEDVVASLKGQVSELEEQLRGHKQAFENMRTKYEAERQRQFTEAGWFVPKTWVNDNVAESLNHLITRAKQASVTNVIIDHGQPYEIQYEADWIKYAFEVSPAAMPKSAEVTPAVDLVSTLFDAIKHGDEAHREWLQAAIKAHFAGEAVPEVVMKADDQSWVVKMGAAVARYQNPLVINGLSTSKLDEIYKRLMIRVGMPNSHSCLAAFQQLVNELTYGSASLLGLVQLVAGNVTEDQVFWGNTNPHVVDASKLPDSGDGTHPAAVAPRLGQQAGVAHYTGGRVRFYDMGDTYAAELKVYPVFFEEGQIPPELSPLYVKPPHVGMWASEMDDVLRKWLSGNHEPITIAARTDVLLQNASAESPQAEYERELGKYIDLLDASLDAYISESMFKVSPDYMKKLSVQIREHYIGEWKRINGPLFLGDAAEQSQTFFTEAQLADPTLLQKAVVMGMAGNEKQQAEARHFLTQYLAVTSKSHAATDAYLKL